MDKFNEQLFEMIGRCRSSAGSTQLPEPRAWYMENGVIVSKPIESKESKAASVTSSGINKVKVIADFINGKHY